MPEPTGKAVFLSYASQDAEAVLRIAEALRAIGVEVWFDKDELVGGDAWDAKIRKQIAECALFVPVISANTQARTEGYFRLEWKLAAQRTHMIADDAAFLLPVVIDETRDADARVPAEFKSVQWTRLPGGESAAKFCARMQSLLGGEGRDASPRRPSPDASENPGRRGETSLPPKWAHSWLLPALIAGAAIVALASWRPWMLRPSLTASDSKSPPSSRSAEGGLAPVERTRTLLNKVDVTRAELELAEEMMAQAAKVEPTNAEVFAAWTLVDCRFLEKNYDYSAQRKDAARRHAAQATSLAPESFEVRFARMESLRRLASDVSSRAEVRRLLEELRRQRPDDPRVLIALAWITYWAGDLNGAFAYLAQTERLPQSAAVAKFTSGLMRAFSGDFAMGMASIEEAVNLQPAVEFLLWKSYLEGLWLGDTKRAQQTLSRVPAEFFLEDMPAAAKFFVLLRARDYEGALNSVRAIPRDYMQSGAGAVPTGYFRGLASSFLGLTAAAESEWQSALATVDQRLAQARNDPDLLKSRALLLSALGRKKEAAEVWRTNRELEGVDRWGWLGVWYAAHQLEPEILVDDIRQLVRDGHHWMTAAELRLNPIYDRVRHHPAFVELQAEFDRNPKHAPSPLSIAPAPAKSVAVLAFKNLSGDPAREFFSDGLSEAVTDVLGRVPGLKVVGSASAFSFKGKSVPIPEIARQLGVTHLVEGTVMQEGTTVRITAKLIKADGFQVWGSDKLDRELKSIIALHDEVAGLIAKNLSLQLGTSSGGAKATVNPLAYELYVQGRQAWTMRGTDEFVAKAEDLFRRAIAADANLGRAYSGLADVLRNKWMLELTACSHGERDSQRALELVAVADTALRLEPESAEAHAARGAIQWMRWRVAEAERDLRAAVRLNPNYADAHLNLGRVLSADGRIDEALAELKRATELDPLSSRIFDNYSGALREAGRYSEALVQAERALALQPDSSQALRAKLSALTELGRNNEALAIAQSSAFRGREYRSVALLVRAGRKDEAAKLYAASKIPPRLTTAPLVALGRLDDALDSLRADNATMSAVGTFHYSTAFDPIRNDPRFINYLTALGIKEAHDRAQAWRKANPPEKVELKK